MRIAIIGSGISGLGAAWLLSREHEVVLFEANDYLGGHTHTHEVDVDGVALAVDTGFIVHNPVHYPLLTRLFRELDVPTQDTTMSFSVHNERTGLEYNANSLDALFCQRRNLMSPRFLRMLADLWRFYRIAPRLLAGTDPGPTLGDYLLAQGFGEAFRDDHLVPMASALWSAPADQILHFPARHLVQFMANHQMLQAVGRSQWKVVRGGSRRYVDALAKRWSASVRLAAPVQAVRRLQNGIALTTAEGEETFDQVVLACHSDQALSLLSDADEREREVLGAIAYQTNDVVLHTDERLLPRNRKAWAAWNAHVGADVAQACTVSYCMNLLQGLPLTTPVVVTLNRSDAIDPRRILKRVRYHHPVFTTEAVAAQARRHEIQGRRGTWFAGAYWGWGFHEDGLRSAVEVARSLGVAWPEIAPEPRSIDNATPGNLAWGRA
ncbi:FAD-dependent oxidoreductase [Lysobacter sp. FW306-1B-D06B]|uniref:NAD(P)/FAD-dependent oxidoreductase n=1 Tax=Lysobacter sp. FW306-1B-D06B TaxID=3140250 RepID=UPI003140547D